MPALPRHNPHALLCLEYIGRAVQPAAPSNPPAAIAPGEQPWPPLAHAGLFAFVRSAHFLGLEWGTTWSFTSGFLPFSHVFKGRPSCGMNRELRFSSWPNSISLCRRVAFCRSVHFTEGRVGRFYFLAVVNDAAVNGCEQFSCGRVFSFLLRLCTQERNFRAVR